MPGFPVLTTLQPIVGVDMHKSIPPPPPAGPLLVPHPVVWGVGLSQWTSFMWAVATSKATSPESKCPKPIAVGAGHACGRTHDAGPHAGHLWPNVLLPLVLLGSASKAEFGSGKVKVGTATGTLDMAVNVAYAMNFNLDCQEFPLPPMPTGMAFTIYYNVTAGFSLMDFVRGLIQMGVDLLISWAVGAICAVLTGAIKGLISGLTKGGVFAAIGSAIKGNFDFGFTTQAGLTSAKGLFNDGAGYFASNGRLFVDAWKALPTSAAWAWKNAPVDQTLNIVGGALSTFGLGTPTGYSPQYTPVGGGDHNVVTGGPSAGTAAGNWVDGLFR
jgi:hypothetical protein